MRNDIIRMAEFCRHCHVEPSFIHELEEDGLIETLLVDQECCLPIEQLANLERFTHLHYDLAINTTGIDAIQHLLQRLQGLQQQVENLQRELKFYR